MNIYGRCADIIKRKIDLEKYISKSLGMISQDIDELINENKNNKNQNTSFMLNQMSGIQSLFNIQ